MSTASPVSEVDILRRALDPHVADLSAESLSRVDFAPSDCQQMEQLAAKARAGTLSEDERDTLHHDEVVNDLVGILRSKARITLRRA